jgi:hypothetical protein
MEGAELRAVLASFTGTTEYHAHSTHWLKFTDGVRYLAEETEAFWLLDRIAFAQPYAKQDAWLREFQLWELHVREDRSAVLICSRDSEDEAFRTGIPSTDFPLDYMKLYVEGGVLLLPSEH